MRALAATAAAWAITWKARHGIDDSLDVFAVHGIAGIAGVLFITILGDPAAPAADMPRNDKGVPLPGAARRNAK